MITAADYRKFAEQTARETGRSLEETLVIIRQAIGDQEGDIYETMERLGEKEVIQRVTLAILEPITQELGNAV